ncbi:Copper amine oxidase N-terminal domain-containing protein [Paenibacillus algorifonticola]|uniref:Copper amine oxidase N-terminal domain-containing protein n=1 Tax=Paenibacillus algorifonticola TaxID=684063 RepID=A0A1I2CPL9_9BACL|nr:stalk domain-containing protein [Paenibacillus algorifonticola]SFE69743.1 Copper amine oxidase N-terminal domain-containing protein [Paenibacillus algorifonticola]
MFKKLTLTLLATALLILPSLPASSSAAVQEVAVTSGQLLNNRVLVPLRVVFQNLGVAMNWSNGSKSVWFKKRGFQNRAARQL